MNTKLQLVAAAVILVAGCGAAYWFLGAGHEGPEGQIRVSGNIETTEAQVSFKIAGRVEKRLVDEGQMVKQGSVVALLDTADLRCNVALRCAEVQTAEAALAALKAGSRRGDRRGESGPRESGPRVGRPGGGLPAPGDYRGRGRRGGRPGQRAATGIRFQAGEKAVRRQ